jgi:hypothetical protein
VHAAILHIASAMLRIIDRAAGSGQRNVVAILPDTPVQSDGSYHKKWWCARTTPDGQMGCRGGNVFH